MSQRKTIDIDIRERMEKTCREIMDDHPEVEAIGCMFLSKQLANTLAGLIVGSEGPKLLKAGLGDTAPLFFIGVVSSAIVGYAAVKYFIRYLGNHSLDVFAWYRLALAATVLVWLWRA